MIAYDYENQAWIVNDRYQDCGHISANCECYGHQHAGELVSAEVAARIIEQGQVA